VQAAIWAGVAHLAVAALVFGVASGAMSRIEAVDRVADDADLWDDAGDAYVLRLSPVGRQDDPAGDASALAGVIKRMERAGSVLFAGYKGVWAEDGGPPGSPEQPGSLIVNHKYLELRPVVDASGRRLTDLPRGPGAFTLLVSASQAREADALLAEYTDYFRDFACREVSGEASLCDPRGQVVLTEPGQDWFTFNGTAHMPAEMQDETVLRDPVVAVAGADSGLLSSTEYLSYTSLADVLFLDAQTLAAELKEEGIAGGFQGIDNAADAAMFAAALSRRELQADVLALALGGLVAVFAAAVMAAVYCDRRRRALFVRTIHGQGFWSRHMEFALAVVVLSVSGAVLAGTAGGQSTPRDLVAAVLLVGLQSTVALSAVRVHERRSRSEFVKRS
jgi:hypothetical protein